MLAVAAALAAAVIAAQAPAASAWDCTPGYWKNHTSAWPGVATSKSGATFNLSPSTRVGDAFEAPRQRRTGRSCRHCRAAADRERPAPRSTPVRAATARLMNAAVDHEKAALDRIPADTSAAIASGSRDAMIALGSRYDALNNGVCRAA